MELNEVNINKHTAMSAADALLFPESIDNAKHSEVDEFEREQASNNFIVKTWSKCTVFCERNKHRFSISLRTLLFIGYFVYFGFAVSYHLGDEESWRLVGFTILGTWLLTWHFLKKTSFYKRCLASIKVIYTQYSKGKWSFIFRWFLYVAMALFMVVYIFIFVAIKTPENLRSLFGIFLFPVLLFLYSNNKRNINWHTIFWSMSLQFMLALVILKTTWGAPIVQWCGTRLQELVDHGVAGSEFIFGSTWRDHRFVFGSMVKIFVLIVWLTVMKYLGVIKFIVETVGRALAFCLDISPPEGINAISNIFLNGVSKVNLNIQTTFTIIMGLSFFIVPESAVAIQEYLPEMKPSQFFVTYTGGLSTVGGVALVIFMSFGVPAAPLIAASTMSAPAALTAAKLVFPSTENEEIPQPLDIETSKQNKKREGFMRHPTSMMDAIIQGINQSVALVVNLVSFIMTFVILLAFINKTFIWFGERIGMENITVEFLLSYLFYPFAFIMGAHADDCFFIGEVLGIRTISLPIVAYPRLGPIIQNGIIFREYVAGGVNNTWVRVGNDIFLENLNKTLIGGVIQPRSEIIATFALCGAASFAIVGLFIGSFAVIVPHRLNEITTHIYRAFIAATVASYMTACFAGLLYEGDY